MWCLKKHTVPGLFTKVQIVSTQDSIALACNFADQVPITVCVLSTESCLVAIHSCSNFADLSGDLQTWGCTLHRSLQNIRAESIHADMVAQATNTMM